MSKGSSLAPLGLFLTTLMYFVQAFVLCSMVDFTGNIMYWIGIAVYVIIFLVALLVHTAYLNGHAKSDKDDKKVWMIWCLYMVIFSISVGLIFFKGAVKLKQSDWFGPNLLKSVLCITPGLLVLLPQLVFSRSFGQVLLTVSISAALNIFDGIEMLEIILMQHERKDFKLNDTAEYLIIIFVCMSFVVTSFCLGRTKLVRRYEIVSRSDSLTQWCKVIEILLNISFLVLRIFVWVNSGYEASKFIAKNVISLLVLAHEYFDANSPYHLVDDLNS